MSRHFGIADFAENLLNFQGLDMATTIEHPLCPYERHPLIPAPEWIRRLDEAKNAISRGRNQVFVAASNSLALLLTQCGLIKEAKHILAMSLKYSSHQAFNNNIWVDSFFNFLRIAKGQRDKETFLSISHVIFTALDTGIIRFNDYDFELKVDIDLTDSVKILIKRHIIYEFMTYHGDSDIDIIKNWAAETYKFSDAGLIFREFSIFSRSLETVEPPLLLNIREGLVEAMIRAIYAAFQNADALKVEEYAFVAATILFILRGAGKIDIKFYYPIYYLLFISKKLGMDSISKKIFEMGVAISKGDFFRQKLMINLYLGTLEKIDYNYYLNYRDLVKQIYNVWIYEGKNLNIHN